MIEALDPVGLGSSDERILDGKKGRRK